MLLHLPKALVLTLLNEWGENGWQSHLDVVRDFYRKQRDAFVRSMEKHLTGLAEWNVPDAGMFVWIRLLGIEDSKVLIEKKAVEQKVLLVPGQVFLPDDEKSSYVRAAYSTASAEQMDTALQRLAIILRNKDY